MSISRDKLRSAVHILKRDWESKWPNQPQITSNAEDFMSMEVGVVLAHRMDRFCNPKTMLEIMSSIASVHLGTTDLRDFVYALLGVASDANDLAIVVDYSKTWQQVFAQFALAMIKNHGLRILSYCQMSDSNIEPELPSWAPLWSTRSRFTPLSQCGSTLKAEPRYFCGSHVDANFRFVDAKPDQQMLLIHGTEVDTVLKVGHVPAIDNHKGKIGPGLMAWLSAVETLALQGGNIYGSSREVQDAIARTTFADLSMGDGLPLFRTRKDIDMVRVHQLMERGPEGPDDAKLLSDYLAVIAAIAENGRFFVSEQGYLGLTRGAVGAGDRVVVLFGTEMAFILRPFEDGKYRLVGEAYVHGIMDDEFLEKNPPAVTFSIC
jgi:hypothetical protein